MGNKEDPEKQPLITVNNPLAALEGNEQERKRPAQESALAAAAALGLSSTSLVIIYYAMCSSTMLVGTMLNTVAHQRLQHHKLAQAGGR